MDRATSDVPIRSISMPAWKRWLLVAAGFVSLTLGMIGAVLPGLPTTPFVLLAGACFVRASPALHGRLLGHRWLGPMLRDWDRHRSLTRRTRRVALVMMTAMVLVSAWLLRDLVWLQAAVLLAGGIGAWVVWRIPVR